jgi:hypothetical protein
MKETGGCLQKYSSLIQHRRLDIEDYYQAKRSTMHDELDSDEFLLDEEETETDEETAESELEDEEAPLVVPDEEEDL